MMLSTHITLVTAVLGGQAWGAALLARDEPKSLQATPSTLVPLPEMGAQAITAFLTCKNAGFEDCVWWRNVQTGVCNDLPGEWNDVLSSAKSEAGFQCYIYKNFGCSGGQGGPITNDERHKDLNDFKWNDSVSSYKCTSS